MHTSPETLVLIDVIVVGTEAGISPLRIPQMTTLDGAQVLKRKPLWASSPQARRPILYCSKSVLPNELHPPAAVQEDSDLQLSF